jgi:predicted dienelactone hydrolase
MRPASALSLAFVLVVAGCGGDDGGGEATEPSTETVAPTTTVPVPDRTEVEHLTLDLVDTSRPTPANGGAPGSDERVLTTEVYVPAGTGPFPLVAFSHGWAGHPRKFTELFQAWAEAGYAVVAPAFPVSNDRAPGGASGDHVQDQPGDISFVLDQVLAASADEGDPLYGAFDPERIAAAGLSLGGVTTYGVSFSTCCRDDRITAAIVMDGGAVTFDNELDSGLPLMIMHGDEDYLVPYAAATVPYGQAIAPKWLVTIHEAIHFEPYEDTPDPADDLVRAATVAFWDLYLGGDESAEQRITDAVTPATLASLESDLG